MVNSIITHLQIFGIGFSFGIIGPCFFVCTPILITYIVGSRKSWAHTLLDIVVFLTARLLAYIILGYLAGLSGYLLKQFISSHVTSLFKPLAGVVSILLGISILFHRRAEGGACKSYDKAYSAGGLFAIGFVMGIVPCAPLTALLLEIALISKTAAHGMMYALSFGIGTFVSGLIVIATLSGILKWIPQKMLKSEMSLFIFRLTCALLLILFGLGQIFITI